MTAFHQNLKPSDQSQNFTFHNEIKCFAWISTENSNAKPVIPYNSLGLLLTPGKFNL